MNETKKYFAFISYKREDEVWAKWLQHKLEHYKLPLNLNGRTDLPREIRPIFRDKSDLAGGVLAEEINNALENSQYLIVICSPRAAQSEWVGKEVQTFIELGRTDKIIPFIIGGTAHSENPEDECFPMALLELPAEQEVLGININEMGRDAAAVKVVAQMFGLRFDELWQRWEREQKKIKNRKTTTGILILLAIAGVALWMYAQWQKTLKANWRMMENQSRFVAEKAIALVDDCDSYMAQRLLLEVLPNDFVDLDKPYTDEAKLSFMKAHDKDNTIIKVHNNTVTAAKYNHDGSRIATAGTTYPWTDSNTIKVFDAKTGKELKAIGDSTGWVLCVDYSPDGKHIVASYMSNLEIEDIFIRIWNEESGELIQKLQGHTAAATSVMYSPKGDKIVSSSLDSTIRIWDAKSGDQLRKIKESTYYINSACFSPDGKYIVSALGDGNIRIWDAESGEIVKSLLGHTSIVYSAHFNPNGKSIVSASADSTIRIWNIETGENTVISRSQTNGVCSADFSPDGNYIVAVAKDGLVKAWDIHGRETFSLEINNFDYEGSFNAFVMPMCISPDGKQIAFSLNETVVRIEKLIYGDELKTMYDEHPISSEFASFSPDGKLLVSAHSDGSIKLWDVATCKKCKEISGHDGWVKSASFSSDGKMIVSASGDNTIKIWDVETGDLIKTLEHDFAVTSAFFINDDKQIASSSYDKTVIIWDIRSKKRINVYRHEGIVNNLAISPNQQYIAACSYLFNSPTKGVIYIWDRKQDKAIRIMKGHNGDIWSLCFSPDGQYIVSSGDREIIVWNVSTGDTLHTLTGHNGNIYDVCFSPDGNRVVSSSEDGTIKIWDVKTGKELRTYGDNSMGGVNAINFNDIGSLFVSASDDGFIRIWRFETVQEIIEKTRKRFIDNPLTPDERRQYYLE